MDKPKHPHVIRTWVVDRIRSPFLNPQKFQTARMMPKKHPMPPPPKNVPAPQPHKEESEHT